MNKKLDHRASNAISATIIIIAIILIATLTIILVTGQQTQTINQKNLEQILDEIFNEITTQIQIKEKIGKYYKIQNEYEIKKIAIMISPLVTNDININQLKIEIYNNEKIKILKYEGDTKKIENKDLFEHPIWKNLTKNQYGFITIQDKDNSLEKHGQLNNYKDNAFLIIKLPDNLALKKGDKINLKLFPSTGITKKIKITAPIPTNRIVTL
ncbi:MAG: hypothetical protein V5A68_04990 [Candidatus Thermoplasmatota archaeon]